MPKGVRVNDSKEAREKQSASIRRAWQNPEVRARYMVASKQNKRLGREHPATPKAKKHPTTLDIAWAAGIYEGEGSCINPGGYGTIHVTQKERWLLDKMQELFGGSIRTYVKTRGAYVGYACSQWSISGARARGFALTIYKFLSPHRQERIKEVMFQNA